VNSSESIWRQLIVVVATAGIVLLGASGAQATPAHAAGPLVAENHDTEDSSDEESSDEDTEDEDSSEDEDDSDNEDENSDEDNESDEPTDEPTEQPTFTDPPNTDTGITEMPTADPDETSEAGSSPLGWILLAGGVACAGAAVAVYRRNRNMM
jgi:hypothetical protein